MGPCARPANSPRLIAFICCNVMAAVFAALSFDLSNARSSFFFPGNIVNVTFTSCFPEPKKTY